MKNQVIIKENSKTGLVVNMRSITDKETGEMREVASVMLQQKSLTGLSRLARVSTRTAFITLELDALEMLQDELIADAPFPFAGKIVIEETLTPYIKSNGEPQDPKTKGKGGAVITYEGKPVYRNSKFTTDLSEQDVLLKESASSQVSPE